MVKLRKTRKVLDLQTHSFIAAQIANIAVQNSNIAAQIARHTATQVTARGQLFHLQLVGYIQGITIDLLVI